MESGLMKLLGEARTMSMVHAATEETRSGRFPRWLRRYACIMLPLPAFAAEFALITVHQYGIRSEWFILVSLIVRLVYLAGIVLAVVSIFKKKIILGLVGLVVNAAGFRGVLVIGSLFAMVLLFPDGPPVKPLSSPQEQTGLRAHIGNLAQDYWAKEGEARRGVRFEQVVLAVDSLRYGGAPGISKSFVIEHLGQPDSVYPLDNRTAFEYAYTDETGADCLVSVEFDDRKDEVDRIGYRNADW